MDETGGRCIKWNKADTERHRSDSTYITYLQLSKLIDTRNIIIGCQAQLGEGNVKLLYNEYKVLIMQDE